MPLLRVFHFNRLAGVDPRLVAFFAWWQQHGPFPITIPEDGALRTDEAHQLELFNRGVSRAKTLADTPHGRGAAVDSYPAIVDPTGQYVTGIELDFKQPATKQKVFQFGALAEAHGLEWGGRWASLQDYPHVEVPDWRTLPFPPKEFA